MTDIEFEHSSGNMFADLGLDEAEALYTRPALGSEVVKILKARGCTQAEAAQRLGLKQPEVSVRMCARFHRFRQDVPRRQCCRGLDRRLDDLGCPAR